MKLKIAVFLPEVVRHLFRKAATVQYPFEKLSIPQDFRGTPVLKKELCIVCKACSRDCPAEAIEIDQLPEEPGTQEKKFRMVIHNDRCVHCAQCAESCPTGAIALNQDYELAVFNRRQLKPQYIYPRAKK